MAIEKIYSEHGERVTRRIERIVGSRTAAEDLAQEAFVRAWRRAPSGLPPGEQAAWMNRVATNLAIDEQRRGRRAAAAAAEIAEIAEIAANESEPSEVVAVREALAALAPHERMVLLLRFELGLAYAEIAELLDVSTEAARKRVERARRSFGRALDGIAAGRRPAIVLVTRHDFDPVREWLEGAGADVRRLGAEDRSDGELERALAAADGVVVAGSVVDVHPALYRERPRRALNDPDLDQDRGELRALRAALRSDLPIVGICRGHQLLNVALGGSLFQDVHGDRVTSRPHWAEPHDVETAGPSFSRMLLGRRPRVSSEHHQAARRLGRGLRVSAVSEDGVIEGIELPGRRLTLGLQWHPEYPESGEAGRRVAEALVHAARR
jgi:putative glutamine amidotransferase